MRYGSRLYETYVTSLVNYKDKIFVPVTLCLSIHRMGSSVVVIYHPTQ